MMPRLLYQRLDELGNDFAIIYPTAGLRMPRIADDATRRAVIRAHNIVTADYFRKLSDRDRKSTRLNSSHRTISDAVLCLKKKKKTNRWAAWASKSAASEPCA